MLRFLSSFVLTFTCCFKDVTASNVPNDIYASLSASDIAGVKAFNPDNVDGFAFGFQDEFNVASLTLTMEHHIMRQAESVLWEGTFGTNLGTLEYFNSILKEQLLIHLTYLPNEARLHERTGITLTASRSGSPPTYTNATEVSGTAGNCFYKAFSFQASPGSQYLDIVQFAVYTNSSGITANSITRRPRVIANSFLSTISVSNHPSFVVVGNLLLQSTGAGVLNETQTEGIMNILAPDVCDQLDAVPTGSCMNGATPTPTGCACAPKYFGDICGIFCDNGMIKEVPPGDREICECNFGWGQDGCVEESPVAHFITKARKTAKTCQDFITGHEEYLYLMPNSTLMGVDPLLAGVVHESIEQVEYSVGNITKTFKFDEFMKEQSFHATMDRTNDLLAAIYIPTSSPVSDRISIEQKALYKSRSTVEEATGDSSGKIGFCEYEYRYVQRFKSGVEQAAAKLFFVAGVQDISTMPTNTSLISRFGTASDEIFDTYSMDGTSMQNIILGFTVIGRDEPGEIPHKQLDALAKCYALEACRSLPIECAPGEQVDSPNGPMCECPSNVTGIQCNLPLLHSSLGLELDYQDVTYVKIGDTALLKCAITTPYPIKELWWSRFDDPEETVYYYDPLLTDTALLNRATRSRDDNTSLLINPTYLSDEGEYKCRIVVWNTLNNSAKSPIPLSKEARMILKVDVPPERVEVTHLTSGRNLSLRCTSVGSKPAANIFWTKTSSDGEETEIEITHKNTEIEKTGKLFDVSERLFYTLEDFEPIARISCVVKHDATDTTLYKNITFVSPVIQNAVSVLMERFEDPVIYSSFENQYGDDDEAGLVQISAEPGFQVLYNTSLSLTASAPGVFPEPSFLWWTGDQTGISGSQLSIENLQENKEYYVLAENPLGRVVLSVNVYVTDDEGLGELNSNDTIGDGMATSQAGLDGAIIGAIIAGSLFASFLIVFAVWYFCIRDQSDGVNLKAKPSSHVTDEDEGLPFRSAEKPLMRTTSTQTLEGRRSRREPSLKGAASADDILKKGPPRAHGTPPPGYKSKERPRSRKLTAYDESASFVGDYTSQNNVADSSSDDNLRSAQEGDESRSERSLLSSDGGHTTGHTNFV